MTPWTQQRTNAFVASRGRRGPAGGCRLPRHMPSLHALQRAVAAEALGQASSAPASATQLWVALLWRPLRWDARKRRCIQKLCATVARQQCKRLEGCKHFHRLFLRGQEEVGAAAHARVVSGGVLVEHEGCRVPAAHVRHRANTSATALALNFNPPSTYL
jgi:hypothetical protein